MQHKTILITGSNGQLGMEFRKLSQNSNHRFIFTDRKTLDFSNLVTINDFFDSKSIDIIINCAAYTAVDKAESEQEQASLINSEAVALLGKIAANRQIFLIHFSTDYVFDGKGFTPYLIDHPTHPVNFYGESKRAGEEAMQETLKLNGLILRTSWVYSEFGNNFVKTMIRLGKERDQLHVINDQVGSPTYAYDLAKFVLTNLVSFTWEGTRVYHYSNEGVCSWYDFAHAIMELKNISCTIQPIPSSQYPTPAQRPSYSVLDKSRIKEDFQVSIPHWRDSLKVCLDKL
ncbi:dTDP-4-dehydrorhamnose reductase [Mongoliitalea daihaiensis]|uniref:dTDP-4-dehydrorhamnose reductase n=1 Tax=Mongoliitalea daihaiensis TaxID=2782006 RepID=UPI001F44942A|nr:dTDP-4-dehydrorhamnose reductase [Mongoliitalea daihaiensis]UJP64523.1 dTDP-4-dehydrorhamnose reductase [Mongoliitalea daihaiensis]